MTRVPVAALRRGSVVFALLFVNVLGACRPLPEITPNVCGNGVLEPGEDCDGFSSDGLACRPPGESGQCHLDCGPGADGEATGCPAGFGCDVDRACRRATGAFTPLPQRILGNARSLTSGDFDGDGQSDVVSQEQPVFGATKIRAHYFDRSAVPTHSWTSNDPLSTPTLLTLPRDGRQSLAVARFGGVGVLTGEPDGSLISEALPSYFLHGTEGRVFGVFDDPIRDSLAVVVLAERDGKRGLFRESLEERELELAVELPFGVEGLAAEPVVASLFEDDALFPCRELVLAERGGHELNVYSMCGREGKSVVWLQNPGVVRLSLPSAATISAGLLAGDLDGDGHLDLMVGTVDGNYVAYGDGARFTELGPIPDFVIDDEKVRVMPIAAGDLSGDGRADFVLPNSIVLSDPAEPARGATYRARSGQMAAPWTEAAIADFNRDGLLDAVTISREALDVSFFLGTGTRRLNLFTIPTNRHVEHLAVGDFDGDLINDIALVQAAIDGQAEVSIAFGNPSGAPGAPRAAARVPSVLQIAPFRVTPDSHVAFLGVLYRQKDDAGVDGSALALLIGNTDRSLPCVVELTSFSSDGSLDGGASFSATVGAFSTPGVTDVLALALAREGQTDLSPESPSARRFQLWLLRDIASRRGNPLLLGWSFPPELQPLAEAEVTATMATGDLDGDGKDEVVLAGADTTGAKCLLFVARVRTDGAPRVDASSPVVLDAPCAGDTQISVVDLDGDGARDVVLLLGVKESGYGLVTLWGDGSGKLDASAFASLVPESEEPNAYTLLGGGSRDSTSIVYTTPGAVRRLRARENERRIFDDAGVIATVLSGTGVVAADVDGDGVKDLAVADNGAVRILRAELEAQ